MASRQMSKPCDNKSLNLHKHSTPQPASRRGTGFNSQAIYKFHKLSFEAFLKHERPGWKLEVKKRPKDEKGFVPVAKRWVVEWTFAWMGCNRRLSKDYERTITSSEATVKLANIGLLLRRLDPTKNPKKFHYRDKLQIT